MSVTKVKLPLTINIFWHNASPEMFKYAKLLYSFFKRDTEDPLDRYLDIPVYFYPHAPERVAELELANSKNTANIVLVDDAMNLDADWNEFIQILKKELIKLRGRHMLLPVAITENAFDLDGDVSDLNFIRLYQEPEKRKLTFLLITLTHELCRRLYDMRPATAPDQEQTGMPIKLFLSHAKQDAEQWTEQLRDHINRFTGLKSFFDALDIPAGSRYAEKIESQIKKSVLLVFHTDNFSTREWCRREILWAKKHDRPVVVVNQFKKGEYRSFPYIGNVPHIHYLTQNGEERTDPEFFDFILLQTLRETLRFKYKELTSITLAGIFGLKVGEGEAKVLSYPPELISLVNLKETEPEVVIYPDPPLGREEIDVLNALRPDLEFVTPTLLPLVTKDRDDTKDLTGLEVGISLSEVDQMPYSWIQNWAIQDLMAEITKYLLVSEVNLIYSGQIDYGEEEKAGEEESREETSKEEKLPVFNYAKLLNELVRNYRLTYDKAITRSIQPIKNYSFYPINRLIPVKKRSKLKKMVKFHDVKPPDYLNLSASSKAEEEKLAQHINQYDTFDKKFVYAKSLSLMRETMIGKEDARIMLGGKWVGFKGKMPGVLEEALIALKEKKPLYLLGGFGGVTQGVIKAVQGGKPDKLSSSYYVENYPDYAHFREYYNENDWTEKEEKVEYEEIIRFLNEKGRSDPEGYSLNNGLDRQENQRLFQSRNEMEILTLLIKGLKHVLKTIA